MKPLSIQLLVVDIPGMPAGEMISTWNSLLGPFIETGSYAEIADLAPDPELLLSTLSTCGAFQNVSMMRIPDQVLPENAFGEKVDGLRTDIAGNVVLVLLICGDRLDKPWVVFSGSKVPCIGYFSPCRSADIVSTIRILSGDPNLTGNFLLSPRNGATAAAEEKLLERLRDLYGE